MRQPSHLVLRAPPRASRSGFTPAGIVLILLAGCSLVVPGREPEPAPALETFEGTASYYADRFEGRTTASGVRFRQSEMWAAHRSLPFGTRLRVTNVANGRQVEVVVVDRGPFIRGRILDLSRSAARRLDFLADGLTHVRVEVLELP